MNKVYCDNCKRMMNPEVEKILIKTKTLEEFNRICKENNINKINDMIPKVGRHWESLLPKNSESIENHSDPREAFKRK